MVSPLNPRKYKGPDVYLANVVSRNRRPTSADFRQPETGRLYPVFAGWQVGRDPTTGVEGELWMLTKIVDNEAYWEMITSSAPAGTVLSVTGDDGVVVNPDVNGNINTLGQVVANSTHPKAVYTTNSAINTERWDVQLSAAIASTDVTKVGLCAFNNTQFAVDANGFVSLAGGGLAVDSFAMQTGTSPVVPTALGLVTFNGGTVAAGTNPVRTNGTGANTMELQVQISQAVAATDATRIGLSNYNSTHFSVDANGFVSLLGGGQAIDSIGVQTTSGTGTNPVLPTALGLVNMQGSLVAAGTNPLRAVSSAANTVDMQIQTSQALAAGDSTKVGLCNFDSSVFTVSPAGFVTLTAGNNDYHTARWIVSAGGAADGANYTTIATAYAAAVSAGGRQTVFIQPGTYTEDLTLSANVNLAAYPCDANTPTVTIVGKLTANYTGSASITGINLQTNGDFSVTSTTNQATEVDIVDCVITASNNTALNCSNTSGVFAIRNSVFMISNTGIANFTFSGGNHVISFCNSTNSGLSTTANTLSAGSLIIKNCQLQPALTTSGTAELQAVSVQFGNNRNPQNITMLTSGGSGTHNADQCLFLSGTASAISVSNTLNISNSTIKSSNTNAITGAGTLNFADLTFSNSSTINTTTQSPYVVSNAAVKVTAPGAYPYTVVAQDYFVIVDTSSARTINLPASPVTGQQHSIKDNVGSAASNTLTIQGNGHNIDGAASKTIVSNFGSLSFIYNGTQWNVY